MTAGQSYSQVDDKKQIQDIMLRLSKIMDAHEMQLECFCRHGVQVEGWLKGELLYFLDNEQAAGRIGGVDREATFGTGRQKIDFYVEMPTFSMWLETKHWLVGYQKGQKYNASFYFGDPSPVGIRPDVEKLIATDKGHKYLLVLATRNPGRLDWEAGIDRFNQKFSPLRISSLTNPNEFRQSYFLGLLEVYQISKDNERNNPASCVDNLFGKTPNGNTRGTNLPIWLNIDKPTRRCTMHVESCPYTNTKHETPLKGIGELKRDGGWLKFASTSDAINLYSRDWENKGYELRKGCRCLERT